MAVNKQETITWFDNRKGKLTYSMYGSRNGSDGTADCSGSVTQAVKDAGAIPYDFLYSTVTLAGYLAKNGYQKISVNQDWDAEAGDIILMSWGNDMSTSAGAGGHVGVMKDSIKFISVDYWTGGILGTAVSEHNWNDYYAAQYPNYIEVWRPTEGSENSNNNTTNKTQIQEESDMIALIHAAGAIHKYEAGKVTTLANNKEVDVIRDIYKSNHDGEEIPVLKKDAEWIKLAKGISKR